MPRRSKRRSLDALHARAATEAALMRLEFLDTTEAGYILHLSPSAVRRKCASGELPSIKVGRGYRLRPSTLRSLPTTAAPQPVRRRA